MFSTIRRTVSWSLPLCPLPKRRQIPFQLLYVLSEVAAFLDFQRESSHLSLLQHTRLITGRPADLPCYTQTDKSQTCHSRFPLKKELTVSSLYEFRGRHRTWFCFKGCFFISSFPLEFDVKWTWSCIQKQTICYLGTAMKIRQHCAKSFVSEGVQTCRELTGCAFTNIKIAQIHHKNQ